MNIKLLTRLFFVSNLAFLLVACGDDKPVEPEIETSEDVKIVSVNTTALTASIVGSFEGMSKVDLALGEKGVLYCVKSADAASVFKSWLDGNDIPDCEKFTAGSIQGGEYVGVIKNLYPETEYNFCIYSKSKDGKTRKISSLSSFVTGSFNPVFKPIVRVSPSYTFVQVTYKEVKMNELDASSCTIGVLVSTKSGAEPGVGTTLTPYNGYYEQYYDQYISRAFGVKPDSSYYCRLYVEFKNLDGGYSYLYGPETSFSARTSEELAVDLNLPSGLKWALLDVGEGSSDALADDRDYWPGWQYFHWGSLRMFQGLRNVAPNKNAYEYWNKESNTYTFLADDIKGTEYDAAHMLLGGKWRMPTKEEVQELMDSTALYWTTGVGHGVNENYRSGSILHLDRDSIIGGSNSVPFIFHIGGFWTSTFEDGYPVAYDVIADETNDRFVTAGHMELVTGKGGEYARHIRAVWDPNM